MTAYHAALNDIVYISAGMTCYTGCHYDEAGTIPYNVTALGVALAARRASREDSA